MTGKNNESTINNNSADTAVNGGTLTAAVVTAEKNPLSTITAKAESQKEEKIGKIK